MQADQKIANAVYGLSHLMSFEPDFRENMICI